MEVDQEAPCGWRPLAGEAEKGPPFAQVLPRLREAQALAHRLWGPCVCQMPSPLWTGHRVSAQTPPQIRSCGCSGGPSLGGRLRVVEGASVWFSGAACVLCSQVSLVKSSLVARV